MINRLKSIRLARGLTLQQLSKASKLGVSTINNYENGRTLASERFLKSVAAALGVAPDEIAPGGSADSQSPQVSRVMFTQEVWRQVPVVSWARAGEAHDYSDVSNQLEQTVETNLRDPNAFALVIEGESMEPEFHAGDTVVFAPNSEARNGDFVVCRMKESHGVLFKRFRRTGREGLTIRLESINPVYKPQEFPAAAFRFIYPAAELKRRLRR